MANEYRWLVTFEVGAVDHRGFEELEDALCHMRDHRGDGPLLWARSDIGLISPGAEPALAPKKKRTPRKRKESPDGPETKAATPSAAETGSSGEVRPALPPAPAPAPATPPAVAPATPARPSCGGSRCREKGGIVIHDANDLSCGKMHPKRTVAR